MIAQLDHFEVQAISSAQNTKANILSKLASSNSLNIQRSVMVEVLKEKSITDKIMTVNNINHQGEWFNELVAYKLTSPLLQKGMEARKLKRQSNCYMIFQNQLYKKSFSLPLLKCATTWEYGRILEAINEGICENHIGGKALALKALRAIFYWPSMLIHAQSYVKKCKKCHTFSPINRPANYL